MFVHCCVFRCGLKHTVNSHSYSWVNLSWGGHGPIHQSLEGSEVQQHPACHRRGLNLFTLVCRKQREGSSRNITGKHSQTLAAPSRSWKPAYWRKRTLPQQLLWSTERATACVIRARLNKVSCQQSALNNNNNRFYLWRKGTKWKK